MVTPMANSITGESISEDMRPLVIGMLIGSASLAYVIGAPVISQLSDLVGWQYTFLSYILVLNVISILLALRYVPSSENPRSAQTNLFSGFSTVVKNRSASACLIGTILGSASWQGIVFFSTSFYRSSFELPTVMAAYLLSVLAIFFTVGSVLSGKITNRIGRKKLTIIGLVLMGLFTVLFTNIPVLWFSFPIAAIGSFFVGFVMLLLIILVWNSCLSLGVL